MSRVVAAMQAVAQPPGGDSISFATSRTSRIRSPLCRSMPWMTPRRRHLLARGHLFDQHGLRGSWQPEIRCDPRSHPLGRRDDQDLPERELAKCLPCFAGVRVVREKDAADCRQRVALLLGPVSGQDGLPADYQAVIEDYLDTVLPGDETRAIALPGAAWSHESRDRHTLHAPGGDRDNPGELLHVRFPGYRRKEPGSSRTDSTRSGRVRRHGGRIPGRCVTVDVVVPSHGREQAAQRRACS